MMGATLVGLCSCTSDETGQVERMLQDGKIVFSASQAATTGVTRSVIVADPLPLSGYKQELWLQAEHRPMVGGMVTRGTQLTQESVMTDFGVSAYKTGKEKGDLEGRTPNYFYNLKAERVGETSDYTINQDYYWPSNDERLWFYAYYPYNSKENRPSDNQNVKLSPATTTGPQTIDYTVAADVADQVDLMTARTGQTDAFLTQEAPRVDLNFEHQLTGVRFRVGDQFPTKGYIQSIQLKNVYRHGVYTIGNGWSHEEGDRGNFSVTYNDDEKLTGSAGQMITDDDEVFLMIPTTFTAEDEAEIIVRFWDGYDTHTVSTSLTGTTWTAGETVTYSLSSEKLTTLKIQSLTYPETVSGAPYTDWVNGDAVGLYVVANGQNGGTDLRYKNVKCTYQDGQWTIANVVVNDKYKPVVMYPGDNYYFYYPYVEGEPAGKPSAANEANATADAFWSSVVAQHSVKTDQSLPANFKASDLQIAKAVLPSDEGSNLPASTVKATMIRQVGLARFRMATAKSIYTKTFLNNTEQSSSSVTLAPSTNFLTNKPYLNGGVYYFMTKPNETTTFNSNPSDVNYWKEAVNITLAAGEYTADADMVTVKDNRDGVVLNNYTYNYDYQGSYKQFTMPGTGTAVMECWGAQGGDGIRDQGVIKNNWGLGGYVKGTLSSVDKDTKFYVYVGQKGNNASQVTIGGNLTGVACAAAWNGGGAGSWDGSDDEASGSGGGATDIRTVAHATWSNFNSLKSRIMVAGAGSGQQGDAYPGFDDDIEQNTIDRDASANPAGGLKGYDDGVTGTTGGSQTSGYKFGIGQDGDGMGKTNANKTSAGGGGGYYGGTSVTYSESEYFYAPGAGGSSFISGHNGCNAISSSSTESNISHTGSANHYSGYIFTNTLMIDGHGYVWTTEKGELQQMPKPTGGYYDSGKGHTGNGYARIMVTFDS